MGSGGIGVAAAGTSINGASRKRYLLATTAFAGGVFAALLANPQSALAVCNIVDGGANSTVNCDPPAFATTNTVNIDGATAASVARNQQFTTDTVQATISTDITGAGLHIQVTGGATQTIQVTNNGTVNNDGTGTSGSSGALEVTGLGGLITYSGNGSATNSAAAPAGGLVISNASAGGINIGTSTTPVVPNYTGNNGVVLQTADGTQNVFFSTLLGAGTITLAPGSPSLANDDGLRAAATGAGAVNLTLTGNTSITGPAGFQSGILSNTAAGAITISSNANIGSAAAAPQFGIVGVSSGNAVTLTQTGGTIFATAVGGLRARTTGGAGAVVVNMNAGTINGNSSGTSTGIFAEASGTGTGSVTVNVAGTITQVATGVNAQITNTGNTSLVTVNQTGGMIQSSGNGVTATSNGTGGVRVNLTGGQIGTGTGTRVGGIGVNATTSGAGATAGDVFVTGNTMFTTGNGIDARIQNTASTGTLRVDTGGAIDSLGIGVNAFTSSTSAASTVTVNIAHNITSTSGIAAVQAAGLNGLTTINQTAGIIQSTRGIVGQSQGAGGVLVNQTGGQIGTSAATPVGNRGIEAVGFAGNTGDITVNALRVFASTDAVFAQINATASGNIIIGIADNAEIRGGFVSSGAGVRANNGGTGDARITVGNNATVIGDAPAMAAITAFGNAPIVVGNGGTFQGSSGLIADAQGAGAFAATVQTGTNNTITFNGSDVGDSYNGYGVVASNAGTGATSVTTGAGTTVNGFSTGVLVSQRNAGNANAVTIDVGGDVSGNGTIANSALLNTYTAAFTAAGLPNTGLGAAALTLGTGTVTVTGAGNVSGVNVGIQALSAGTGPAAGNNGVVVSGTGNTSSGAGVAINAVINNAANASNVLVSRSGTVTGATGGVNARTNGTGNVTVTGTGATSGGTGTGINATAVSGNVAVTPASTVAGATGINTSTGGAGTTTITTAAGAGGNVTGNTGAGIAATSTGSGLITINNFATTTGATSGVQALNTGTGSIVLVNNGTIIGSGLGTTPAVSSGTTGAGSTTTITNNGLIRSVANSTGDLAISSPVTTGAFTIQNAGTLTGRVNLTDGADTLTSTGLWNVTGVNDFLGGGDALTNGGTLNAGSASVPAATTTFANLENVTNNLGAVFNAGLNLGNTTTFNSPTTLAITNSGTMNVLGTLALVAPGGVTYTNNGTLSTSGGFSNTGTLINNAGGTINGGVSNSNTFNNAGTLNGGLTNTAGTTTNSGTINGGAVITGGTLNTNTATSVVNGGLTNSATVNAAGQINGAIANNAGGAFTVVGNLTGNNTFTNAAGATLAVNAGTSFTGITTLSNGGTATNNGTLTTTGGTTNTGTLTNNAGATINGGVSNSNTFGNAGTLNGGLTNTAGTTTNSGTINGGAVITGGTLNTNTAASVVNGGLTNSATVNAAGQINGAIANNAGGAFTVVGNLTGNNTFTNAAGATLAVNAGTSFTGITTLSNGGTATNNGTLTTTGDTTNTGTLTNNAGATINGGVSNSNTFGNAGTLNGGLTNTAGTTTNSGTINGGAVIIGGTLNTNTATSVVNGGLTNSATVNAAGQINGAIANNAGGAFTVVGNLTGNNTFTNAAGATLAVNAGTSFTGITTLSNGGTATNNGTLTTTGGTTNNNLLTNTGTLNGGLNNTSSASNSGAVNGGVTNSGTFTQTAGSTSGGFTNTGTVNVSAGAINGPIANNAPGVFNVTGVVTSDSTFANANGATLAIGGAGNYTIAGLLTNGGAITVAAGGRLTDNAGITNTATGTITVAFGGTVTDVLNNAGLVNNSGTYNADVNNTGTVNNNATGVWNGNLLSNTGTVNNTGTWNGNGTNNTGGTVNNTGTWNGNFTNNAGGIFNSNATTSVVTGALTNSGLTNAQGQLLGAIVNNAGGTLNVVGPLTIGASLNNAGTLNANQIPGAGGTTTIASAGALAFTNSGTFNAGLVPGAAGSITNVNSTGVQTVTNSGVIVANGTLNFNGAAGSTFTNTGALVMAGNGNTTDRTNLNGFAYTGTAGQVNVDYTVAATNVAGAQQADRLAISGAASGTTVVNFTQANPAEQRVFLARPIVVAQAASGAPTTFTAGTGLPAGGLINYSFQQLSGPANCDGSATCYAIVSQLSPQLNAAVISPVTSITSALSSIDTSFHQPASALVASAAGTDPNKWTGGLWIRSNGGQTTVKSSGSSFDPIFGSAFANVQTRTTFAGVQAGFDSGVLNFGGTGWNGHVGVTAGFISATSQELLVSGTRVNFEVPFVGLYGVLTRGGFFVDAAVRQDFYGMKINDATLFPVTTNNPLSGEASNVNGNIGYHFDLPQNWFIEPSLGLSVTRSRFDNLATAQGTIAFSDVHSLLGRAGVRIGTSVMAGQYLALQPFMTLSVWHEFEDSAASTFSIASNAGPGAVAVLPITTNRVGTFGQIGLGVSGQILQSPFVWFARGDGRFGARLEGWGAVAGARATF